MSVNRWTDKELVVHIHNGILLSHKKTERIWVCSNEVNEPGVYYTEWSESERERKIPYSNTYIQNLERWHQIIFLQGSKWRNRHREQIYGHGERGGEAEVYGKSNMETSITICKTDVVIQSPSHVQLFASPWTAARQASLSFTISWTLPKFMLIASVMPSSHLILWCPLLPLPSIFASIRNCSNDGK